MTRKQSEQARPKYYLKTVGDALRILDFMSGHSLPIGIAELERNLPSMGRSKIHRVLDTLRYWGCVVQEREDRRYRLGPRVLQWAAGQQEASALVRAASEHLSRLSRDTGETTHLAALEDGEVLYLDKKEGGQAIGIISRVGQRLPAHCTGLGKALLAHLPADELKAVLRDKGMPRMTPNTITDPEVLAGELARVRRRGYAVDEQEIAEGLRCIAAPVRDARGSVVAAISISVPAFRMDESRRDELARLLTSEAGLISAELGFGPGRTDHTEGSKRRVRVRPAARKSTR